MSPSIQDIMKHYEYDATIVQRVGKRPFEKLPLKIEPSNPAWPQHFETLKRLIEKALGPAALSITHVGSTAVPDIPAKAVIDIDLTVPDPTAEDAYVPALESVGFVFLTREPTWHEHRFFNTNKPYCCNLHVFAYGTAELVRHQIMKEWLVANEDDRELYARTKRRAMEESILLGETVMQYNARKEKVVRDIWKFSKGLSGRRAFFFRQRISIESFIMVDQVDRRMGRLMCLIKCHSWMISSSVLP